MKRTDGSDDNRIFTIIYYKNLIESGIKKQHNETVATTRYDKTVLTYEEAFPEYDYDTELYKFSHWAATPLLPLNSNYQPNSLYTLDFDNKSTATKITETPSGTPWIYKYMYAAWQYNYTLIVKLENGEVVTGASTLDWKSDWTYDLKLSKEIVPDGVTVTREGYKLIGWQEEGSDTVITNNTVNFVVNTSGSSKVKVVLVPVWERVYTVETGGYQPGTLN